MALGIPLPDQVRRVRHVTVGEDLAVTIDSANGAYFASLLQPPKDTAGDDEGPPRGRVPHKLFWESVQALGVSGRVELQGGDVYELLTRPRTIRVAEEIMGYEVELMKLTELYPRVATLRESDGTTQVTAGLRCSVYSPDERVAGRGDFENFRGEAPIEHEAALQVKNRILIIGSKKLRVVSAVPNYELPHVGLELKRAAG